MLAWIIAVQIFGKCPNVTRVQIENDRDLERKHIYEKYQEALDEANKKEVKKGYLYLMIENKEGGE